MAQIYQNAALVIAWLGTDPEMMRATKTISWMLAHQYSHEVLKATNAMLGILSLQRNFEEMYRDALLTLLGATYFTRLWIIQEILLAKDVRIMCGSDWLELSDLRLAYEDVNIVRRVHTCAPFLIWDWEERISDGTRKSLGLPNGRQLSKCIERYASNHCEYPRDCLYGLKGLANEADCIEVDYAK